MKQEAAKHLSVIKSSNQFVQLQFSNVKNFINCCDLRGLFKKFTDWSQNTKCTFLQKLQVWVSFKVLSFPTHTLIPAMFPFEEAV